jgi:hypothetical protein
MSSVAIYSLCLRPGTKYLRNIFLWQKQKEEKLGSYVYHCGLLFSVFFWRSWNSDVHRASKITKSLISPWALYFPKRRKKGQCGPARCVCVCERERESLHLCDQNELTLYIGSSSRFMRFEVLLQWILFIMRSCGLWRGVPT